MSKKDDINWNSPLRKPSVRWDELFRSYSSSLMNLGYNLREIEDLLDDAVVHGISRVTNILINRKPPCRPRSNFNHERNHPMAKHANFITTASELPASCERTFETKEDAISATSDRTAKDGHTRYVYKLVAVIEKELPPVKVTDLELALVVVDVVPDAPKQPFPDAIKQA